MTVDEEAALWVARIQSADATDADRAACAAWVARDPAHAAAFTELEALWGTLDPFTSAPAGAGRPWRVPRCSPSPLALPRRRRSCASGPTRSHRSEPSST